ncbi:hypothetical protein JNB11_06415 [Kocuria palustris]|nr:hypothetical protein [Kocuria palustris]
MRPARHVPLALFPLNADHYHPLPPPPADHAPPPVLFAGAIVSLGGGGAIAGHQLPPILSDINHATPGPKIGREPRCRLSSTNAPAAN